MKKFRQLFLGIMLMFSANSAFSACDVDFSWSSGRDMAGAYFICGFTAFTQGECPEVLFRCFTDWDLMHWDCGWDGCELVHECLRMPNFFWNSSAVECATDKGFQRAASQNNATLNSERSTFHNNNQDTYQQESVEAEEYLDVWRFNVALRQECERYFSTWTRWGRNYTSEDDCYNSQRQTYPTISTTAMAIVREEQAREGQTPDGPGSDSNWQAGPEFSDVNEEYHPEDNPYGYITSDNDWGGYTAPVQP